MAECRHDSHHGLPAFVLVLMVVWLAPGVAVAAERLSLSQVVAVVLQNNPDLRASRAGERQAAAQASEARAGYLPRVDLAEAWQRGDNPVFVFGSLLSQQRFTEANFAIARLNHPDAVTNYRGAVSVEQPLFDPGRLVAIRTAAVGQRLAVAATREAEDDLVLAATRAYGQLLQATANRAAAESGVEAAREDAARAERRRDAGMTSEADVLSLRVHLAQMQERQIRATSGETIARAQLNRLMGVPLDRDLALEEPLPARAVPALPAIEQAEKDAVRDRAAMGRATLAVRQAGLAAAAAKSAFLPQVVLQGTYEINGASFADRASSWTVAAQARWNLFSGLGDVARVRAATEGRLRAEAARESAESGVRLEVRAARAELEAAIARESVGRASVLQARESQRIIRDRYESGLASVNDVLRAANALLDAESLRVAAIADVTTGQAALNRALGTRIP